MSFLFRRLCLGLALLLITNISQAVQLEPVTWPEKSAVAWQTSKTLFLFKKEQPVGISLSLIHI